mmetsp:Transcript_44947/g.94306  ORF Transcript_44947/g.94306 Transcript_44947/m.94306 type:complete len:202 (-) Transcript_44947:93-698(-)
MVPWSMTSTANSLKIDPNSSMLFAICEISLSRDWISACKSSTTAICCDVPPKPVLKSFCNVPSSSRLIPNRASLSTSPPDFCALTSAKYFRCFCRKSDESDCNCIARLRWTLAPTVDSSPPACRVEAPTLWRCRSALRKRVVTSVVFRSICRSMLSRSLPKTVPMRDACMEASSDMRRWISATVALTESTSDTQSGGRVFA